MDLLKPARNKILSHPRKFAYLLLGFLLSQFLIVPVCLAGAIAFSDPDSASEIGVAASGADVGVARVYALGAASREGDDSFPSEPRKREIFEDPILGAGAVEPFVTAFAAQAPLSRPSEQMRGISFKSPELNCANCSGPLSHVRRYADMGQMGDQMTTISVSSASELMSALAGATGGDTILLAPGDYGVLDLRSDLAKFASEVTLKSADPDNPATITSMQLSGVENLTLDSIKFDYTAPSGTPDWNTPFLVQNSTNVTIQNSTFDGDLATGLGDILDGYGTGFGLAVYGSSGIAVDNNEFYNFTRAGIFSGIEGLSVTSNEVRDIRSDGFDFVEIDNVLIQGNYLYNFGGSEDSDDHPDMIQFWTYGTQSPSTNIVIRDNILDSGSGTWTQSIFMRNEAVDSQGGGADMFYQNVTIENNLIYNGHLHGITVGETVGLTIQNNTLLQNQAFNKNGDELYVPMINITGTSQDVSVINNVVPQLYVVPTAGQIVENNLIVQVANPDLPNYVGDLFVNALAGADATLSDLQALPGGIIEQSGVGADLSAFVQSLSQAEGSTLITTAPVEVPINLIPEEPIIAPAHEPLAPTHEPVAPTDEQAAPTHEQKAPTHDQPASVHETIAPAPEPVENALAINVVTGTSGNDQLTGTDGVDEIFCVAGKDAVYAGGGDDIVYAGDKNWGMVDGGAGNDTLYGGDANDVMYGRVGDDILFGEAGSNRLYGGDGSDTLIGTGFQDRLFGDAGNDVLVASDSGGNILEGGDGNDQLFGGAGGDRLSGGNGDDILDGGMGKDTLCGGMGADSFVFEKGCGRDLITDFNVSQDVLVLKGLGFGSAADVIASAFVSHGDLYINLDGSGAKSSSHDSDIVQLAGVSLNDLGADNFLLVA